MEKRLFRFIPESAGSNCQLNIKNQWFDILRSYFCRSQKTFIDVYHIRPDRHSIQFNKKYYLRKNFLRSAHRITSSIGHFVFHDWSFILPLSQNNMYIWGFRLFLLPSTWHLKVGPLLWSSHTQRPLKTLIEISQFLKMRQSQRSFKLKFWLSTLTHRKSAFHLCKNIFSLMKQQPK